MIVKCYKQEGSGFSGQQAATWTQAWAAVELEKTFRVAGRDYLWPFFLRYFPRPPKRILEGGCGVGKYVAAYRRLGYDIRGIDFSTETVARIKKFDETLPVDVGNIVSLPYRDGSFDCYYSGGVIEHFEEGPARPLEEARRVLTRGGLLLATVPYLNIIRRTYFAVRSERRDRNLLLRRCDECSAAPATPTGFEFDEYLFDLGSVRPFFERAGFFIEATIPTDFLWGEVGLALVSTAKRLKGRRWDSASSRYDQMSDSILGSSGNSAANSLAYEFFVTENWQRPGFRLPLSAINRLSGHMLFVVARAV